MATLLAGLSLGLSAGITPGPLTTLVITTALARGFGAGLRVAIAPLLTDAPIIVLSLLIFNHLPSGLATLLPAAGGCFVIYLGIEAVRTARHVRLDALADGGVARQRDLLRGLLVNVLNPHPWLFWLGVGGPILTTAWKGSLWGAAAFLLGFYGLLVGSKIGLVWGIARGRHLLTARAYRLALTLSGLLLVVLGGLLLGTAVQTVL
jgi:threonine/homoserine/homoserine lactone efflux protein